MSYSKLVWNQLKAITLDRLIKALVKDGWVKESSRGATSGFTETFANGTEERRRIVLHIHPGKTFGQSLLKAVLADIGWSEADLKRLKLIKR